MQRFARGEAFDERAMPDIDSEAISFRVASESFAAIRRLTRRDLQTPAALGGLPRPARYPRMAAIERDKPSLKGRYFKGYARPSLDEQRLGHIINLMTDTALGRVYEYSSPALPAPGTR